MNTPESRIPDEMLSAFLDGELTPDENEQVSVALEQSESLRSLIAELKQIRTEIRQLPRHTLSENFASKVAATCANSPTSTHSVSIKPGDDNSSKLRLIAGIAASAAAILIGLYSIGPGESHVPLAQAERDQVRETTTDSGTSRDATIADEGVRGSEATTATRSLQLRAEQLADTNSTALPRAAGDVGYVDDSELRPAQDSDAVDRFKERSNDSKPVVHAVVRVSLSPNAPALSTRWFAYEPSGIVDESESGQLDKGLSLLFAKQAIPAKAKTLVMEGTRDEIEKAFQELNATPRGITLLESGVDATSMGLPVIESLAQSVRSRRAMQEAVAPQTSQVLDSSTSKDGVVAQSQKQLKDEKASFGQQQAAAIRAPQKFSESRPNVAKLGSDESTARRFRIVLIVEPPTRDEQP